VPVLDGPRGGTPGRPSGDGGRQSETVSHPHGEPTGEVVLWLGKVAGALDVVHGTGVIHRGVRPSAILFDGAGEPALGEYCAVKAFGEPAADAVLSASSSRGGEFFAPEADAGAALTPAFDQYGLAVVAYEALSGRSPHHGQSGAAAVVVRQAKPAQPIREVVSSVPEGVAAALARALERDPAKRFPSCTAFAQAFAAAVRPRRRPGRRRRDEVRRRAPPRRPRAVGGGAAAAAAAAPSDPHATRMLPKPGAKKAPRPDLPAGEAPRKKGGKTLLGALLGGLVVAAVAVVFLKDDEQKETPVRLAVTYPLDGTMVTSPDVLIRGEYSSPRKTDVVKVEGVEVIATDGKFDKTVRLSQEGLQKIEVTVEDKGQVKKRLEWRITYRAVWRPLLDEAKRFADAGQWIAAKEKLAVAKTKGASTRTCRPTS
jgi:hypothetical protein